MHKIFDFIRKERLYFFLAVFILLVHLLMALYGEEAEKPVMAKEAGVTQAERAKIFDQEMLAKREEAQKLLEGNTPLAAIVTMAMLLIFAIFLLGLVFDIMLLSMKLSRKALDIRTRILESIRWGMLDVARVVVLFFFFGYTLVVIESFLISVFPLLRDDNFRMMFNTSILDVLVIALIIYFVADRHKEGLAKLGITLKNFRRNVFYGITGYVAAIPVLAAVLVATTIVINLTKYMPEKQPIVELFLKEKDATFLFYSSLFTAIVGPFAEELFFRGFMYSAVKKYTGVFWAMAATSALFAALHSNLAGFAPIMVLGMLLAYLYEKTGSLVSSITVHIIHNLGMVFLVFLIREMKVF
ncbi:MAG: CPBP family intramembrane metalloprotease [Candidatus Omnitrophica bacterium]|nr:CPBP family intramembrane metalloprotease [Candidatus Omnitrophota bacterium]